MLVVTGLAVPAAAQTDDVPEPVGVVDVIEVAGLFDPVLEDFVTRSIADASSAGSVALVIQLNSGGAVVPSDRLEAIAATVADASVPVGVWVGPSGSRAGRDLIPLLRSADVVGLSPGSRIEGLDCEATPPVIAEGLTCGDRFSDAPTLGDFVVDLDGRELDGEVVTTARVVQTADGPRREPVVKPRFSKLGLLPRLMHTVSSPSVAYLLIAVAVSLLIFEFFTGGVGVAGVTGAACGLLGAHGLAVLPTTTVGLALLAVASFGFFVDVQTGIPRFWTGVGVVTWVAGSVTLFDGVSVSWLALVAGIAGTVLMMVGATPAVIRSRYGTTTIGRESLVGELGEAVEAVAPDGVVRVRGALWRARVNRATPLSAGDAARVVSVDGVVLEVEPTEGAARDHRSRGGR